MKQVESSAGFLLGLFFGPEIGGNISLKTSTDFQPTTRRYVQETWTLHFDYVRFEILMALTIMITIF
jgi:hypothetical protein